MNTPKPDNSERNARIVDLARQGKAPAEIARELGLGRGIVNGVVHRGATTEALPGPNARPRPSIGKRRSRKHRRRTIRKKDRNGNRRTDANRKGEDAGRGTVRSARPGTRPGQGPCQGLVPGLECDP